MDNGKSTAIDDPSFRKDSVPAIEIQDGQGRRRTVQLSDLNDADKQLAAEFGYKPVGHAFQSHDKS